MNSISHRSDATSDALGGMMVHAAQRAQPEDAEQIRALGADERAEVREALGVGAEAAHKVGARLLAQQQPLVLRIQRPPRAHVLAVLPHRLGRVEGDADDPARDARAGGRQRLRGRAVEHRALLADGRLVGGDPALRSCAGRRAAGVRQHPGMNQGSRVLHTARDTLLPE
eukprot:1456472-Prymnesium_polylepis.1